ncbi:hypothetical protein [Streptomyces bohaiensis]|uniref:Uncharacterized protein n=1 Tax=Streptomyces bohaiensis TaxID=1431344 RepID=A0ABX1C351_9ACTN|nr:hypothetical protein [Streptomyces bohaiensis]NJQ13665.1 hypothetical protein [Streptomyces bohaiensis]
MGDVREMVECTGVRSAVRRMWLVTCRPRGGVARRGTCVVRSVFVVPASVPVPWTVVVALRVPGILGTGPGE